jgi:hypothetical protein
VTITRSSARRPALASDPVTDDGPLAAGGFSEWLAGMRRSLGGGRGTEVPCAGCTACCTSSQFVHIGPEETDALAHIPRELLFPAPRMPKGHVLLGYDENGHCPMLGDGGCSIYEHRPRTCRTYDCRVFPAAAVSLAGDGKPAIARRAARWRFDFVSEADRVEQEAVRAAARFVAEQADAPAGPTQRAVLAVRLHEHFLGADPDLDAARAAMAALAP